MRPAVHEHRTPSNGMRSRLDDLARIDKMPDSPVVDKRNPEIIGEASN